jgi:serine protease Do
MKQAFQKFSVLAIAAALFAPVTMMAQDEKSKEKKEKELVEQYIITKKGDKGDKTVIEIVGDKITINGKAVDDNYKDEEVTVKKMRFKELSALSAPGNFNWNARTHDNLTFFNMNDNHAMLGVSTEKNNDGVEIKSVTKESGAEKAGLKEGDIITMIDDKKVSTPDELSKTIRDRKAGDKVSVTYLRDKKVQKVTAELSKWKGFDAWTTLGDNFKMDLDYKVEGVPRVRTAPFGQTFAYGGGGGPKMGLSIQDTDDGKGVKVIEVDDESNASKAGIKKDDLITEVDGKAVNGADEMAKIIKESKTKGSVMMKVNRSGKTQNIEVKIPKKLKTADL